jgi:hypothetical protein
MPRYDFVCTNGHQQIDVWAKYGERPACPECGAATDILWQSSFPNIIPDDVPGGFTVEHMSATPETFYSKSEHRRRCKELGLVVRDFHNPPPGSDKGKFGNKWY